MTTTPLGTSDGAAGPPRVDGEPTPPEAPRGAVREHVDRTWWDRYGETTTVWAARAGLLAVFLLAWQLLSGPVLDDTFISRPSDIAERLGEWWGDGTLVDNSWITVQEIAWGFLLGAATGAAAGYVFGASRYLYRVLDPFVMALYSIPKVALAPLFIVWFGIGMNMKILLAAVTVFFLVFLNTAAAVRDVDRGLIDAVRLMGGGRRVIALKVVLPASMAGFLTGLKVSVPYALIGAVIGELVASNRGLGYLINDSASQFDTAGVFAALVVLTVIAGVLNLLVGLLDRRVNRWKPLDH